MRTLLRFWRSITPEHRDYLYVYMSALLWSVTYFVFTPAATDSIILDRLITSFWLVTASIGAILAIIGLLTKDNLIVERLGVTLVMLTPIVYTLIQIAIIFYYIIVPEDAVTPWESRINLVFLGLWIFFFLNKRRRQLSRQVREAKKRPLASENREDGIE